MEEKPLASAEALSTNQQAALVNPPPYSSTTGKPSAESSKSNAPSPVAQLSLLAAVDREIVNCGARKRLFFAILSALGLWLFFTGTLSTVLSGMVNDGTKHRHGHGGSFDTDCAPLVSPLGPFASLVAKVKESGAYQRIVLLSNSPNHFVLNGTVLRVSASVQYSLPISALDELLVTVSEGHLRGQVIVSQGVGHSEEGVVGVFIHASAEKRSVLEESTVCLRRTQKDDDGTWTSEIGISTTPRRDEERSKQIVNAMISLTLPPSIVSLRQLYVHAPRFFIGLSGELRNVTFGSINVHSEDASIQTGALVSAGSVSLSTSNALIITSGPVEAQNINISTTHGRIFGQWRASNKIVSRVVDGGVSGWYSVNDGGLLIVQTTNGEIEIDVSLLPSSDKSKSTKSESYKVSAESTNGAIAIKFLEQPQGSHLSFDAVTTNAKAEVYLDPQFQGSFQAQSETPKGRAKLFGPITTINSNSGSTERNVELKSDGTTEQNVELEPESPSSRSKVEGIVSWGSDVSEVESKGRATIATSNNDVGIILL